MVKKKRKRKRKQSQSKAKGKYSFFEKNVRKTAKQSIVSLEKYQMVLGAGKNPILTLKKDTY